MKGVQEKESIMAVRDRYKNLSLAITVWHHSASLVMPYNDPRDGFFLGLGRGGGGRGWVTSYVWHTTDVRAELTPFSALPGI